MKRILKYTLPIIALCATAGFPVDPRLTKTIIPVVDLHDANPLDTINYVVSSVLATNAPNIDLGRIVDTPQDPPSMHPSIVTTVDKSTLLPITLTMKNISARALIQAVATAGHLNVIFIKGRIHIETKDDSDKELLRPSDPQTARQAAEP
jgi:hypothetical protein